MAEDVTAITRDSIPVDVRESMGRVVADHGPPFVVDFDLHLNDELDYLPRLCPVVMPDSSVGPYRKCIIGFRQRS